MKRKEQSELRKSSKKKSKTEFGGFLKHFFWGDESPEKRKVTLSYQNYVLIIKMGKKKTLIPASNIEFVSEEEKSDGESETQIVTKSGFIHDIKGAFLEELQKNFWSD